jgi:hypothetical protein
MSARQIGAPCNRARPGLPTQNPGVPNFVVRDPFLVSMATRKSALMAMDRQVGSRSTTVPPDSPDVTGFAIMDWQRGSARSGTDHQAIRILHAVRHRRSSSPMAPEQVAKETRIYTGIQ